MTDELLTTQDLMHRLKVSRAAVNKWRRLGYIKGRKVAGKGNQRYYSAAELAQLEVIRNQARERIKATRRADNMSPKSDNY